MERGEEGRGRGRGGGGGREVVGSRGGEGGGRGMEERNGVVLGTRLSFKLVVWFKTHEIHLSLPHIAS